MTSQFSPGEPVIHRKKKWVVMGVMFDNVVRITRDGISKDVNVSKIKKPLVEDSGAKDGDLREK